MWQFALGTIIIPALTAVALKTSSKMPPEGLILFTVMLLLINMIVLGIYYRSGTKHAISDMEPGEEGEVLGRYIRPATNDWNYVVESDVTAERPLLICLSGRRNPNWTRRFALLFEKHCGSTRITELEEGDKVRYPKDVSVEKIRTPEPAKT